MQTETGLGEKKFLGQIAPGNLGGKVRQAVPLSFSRSEQYIGEQTENWQCTDRQDRAGYFCYETRAQLSNVVLFFWEIQTIKAIVGLFNVLWQIAVAL